MEDLREKVYECTLAVEAHMICDRHFVAVAWNDTTEFDDDGDGTFERNVEYDRYGEPDSR